ncbi:MAG: hypothetical protein HY736_14190 [Verrucomicrobia bacterium]|nr:hypothetical protein [Verrucomicrobiota bacterium]
MQTKNFAALRVTGLLAGAALALSSVPVFGAAAAGQPGTSPNEDAFPNYESYIKITGQAASISGDGAAFQNRVRQPENGGGGIEDLHVSRDVSKTTTVTIDGRALTGAENYLARINVTKTEFGSVDAGYKRFRTFYDGVGGFFPLSKAWYPLNKQDLHVDRGQFWAEARLAMKDAPEFTLRYSNETRSGKKDSTSWGDSDLTGLPNNNPPISPARKFMPSYLKLGERYEVLEGTMKQTFGKTTAHLRIFGDRSHKLDTRYVTRFPGEIRPFPTPAATLLVPALNMNNEVQLTQTDGADTKSFGIDGTTATVLTANLTLRTGLSYHLVNGDFNGNRLLLTSTPTATGVVVVSTGDFRELAGDSRVKVYEGRISLEMAASKYLAVTAGLRAEDSYAKGASAFNVLAASGTPAVTVASTPRLAASRVKDQSLSPELDFRYTGIADLALYGSGSWRILNGDDRTTSAYNPITSPAPAATNLFFNDWSENRGHYNLGASWRQSALLTLRGDVFQKTHGNKSVGYGIRIGDNYVLDTQFTGLKLTGIFRPHATVTCTTRYVYQTGKMQVTGIIPGAEKYDSMSSKNHTIDETFDWNPTAQFYLQANANLVFNVISTVYPRAGVTPASVSTAGVAQASFNSNNVLQNSDNNYVNGSLLVGAVLTKSDDLQLIGTYYRADNGNAFLAPLTLPFGVAIKEYSLAVGLKHKFSKKWNGTAKLGYFESKNSTTGGNTNFRGPLAYIAFEHAL